MKKITVNNGREDTFLKINEVESKYNAKYVGQFCLRDKHGNWANQPTEVFWQEKPPVEGYSIYFALFTRDGSVFITSGESAVEGIIAGIRASDGEVIYSRYRHDFRPSKDGTVFIDGGRDYTKCSGLGNIVQLKVVDGEFYELEPSDAEYKI